MLIKFGGAAMTDPALVDAVLARIADLHKSGVRVVLAHGGGPFIQELLDALGIESEFIGGHRRTDERAIRYVSMVLSGQVNGEIVARLNRHGARAVGISGRDGGLARATKRESTHEAGGELADLGYVGDIQAIDPRLVSDLLDLGYLPVVAPVTSGPGGFDYNVNADMFAGHLAAALQVDDFVVLTDVDGLYRDRNDSSTLISDLRSGEIKPLLGSVVAGGMIPKVQSCQLAVAGGAKAARIINGRSPDNLLAVLLGQPVGTTFRE